MGFDFVVKYCENLGEEIIKHITVNRIERNKPSILAITGESGEGKSYTALRIAEIINNHYGLDTAEYVDDIVVFTPLEYKEKIENILFNPDLKDLRVLIIDEARELIKSKLWYDFIVQAIADICNIHRRIKPLVLIVVSQFWQDIVKDVRRSVTFYGKCFRPLYGNHVYLRMYRVVKSDANLENPRMYKRYLRGFIVKDGRYQFVTVKQFKIRKPSNAVIEEYEKLSYMKKEEIIDIKMRKLMERIEKDLGLSDSGLGDEYA